MELTIWKNYSSIGYHHYYSAFRDVMSDIPSDKLTVEIPDGFHLARNVLGDTLIFCNNSNHVCEISGYSFPILLYDDGHRGLSRRLKIISEG